ncbi:hypothetical protein KJ359_011283 [Pestalotiopsis sp. 9143b]|nr:hypothetical protein KJ359_011283 [Pestalotiopsis sp. 9143b]
MSVRSSYANINFIKSECPSIDTATNDKEYGTACVIMRANGESYRTLLTYLGEWEHQNYPSNPTEQEGRPGANSIVLGNTTLQSAWVQTDEFPTVAEVDGRLINNVTLAMPHAGLVSMYSHAYNGEENIRQPGSDADFGEYDVVASVVSPSINVLCATAQESEVKPLLGEKDDKAKESPLDDVFLWGKKHNGRYRPTFETVAPDYQFVTDPRDTIDGADSIYTMGKAGGSSEYTVCQLRSILTTNCVSRFQVTNSSGSITAYCGQDVTARGFRSYKEVYDMREDSFDVPAWRDLAVQWNIALGLNNGVINASSANVRLLSGTILSKPELQRNVPSLAEMLAVFASPLLVDSSLGATYSHEWRHGDANDTFPTPGQPEDIVTSYRFQTYISGWAVDMPMTPGHVYYFIVLATLFVISSICLGACGRGPKTKDLGVCFRVGYAETANHYYFEDARDAPARSAAKRVSKLREKRSSRILLGAPSEESQTNLLVADGAYSENYKRLSAKSPLL